MLFGLLLNLAVTHSAQAQDGFYSGPNYSGGATDDGTKYAAYNGGWGGISRTLHSASCGGQITASFPWNAGTANTPVPQNVIVTQTCTASGMGTSYSDRGSESAASNDGLGDTGTSTITFIPQQQEEINNNSCTRTKYTAPSGASPFSVTCSPTSSGTSPSGPVSASVTYTASVSPVIVHIDASVSPVIVHIDGTYDPTHGDYRVLTGQPITASIKGIPGGFTVKNYTWSINPSTTVFKTYNESAANSQLVPLGSADLSGPVAGQTTVANLVFYDRKQESLMVNCTALVIAPDGTSLSVSAQSPSISVEKPTVGSSWGITTGNVHYSTQYGGYGLFVSFGSTAPGGVYWSGATVSVPTPFSGGTCCFTQLVKPNHQYNGIGRGANNNVNGLDNSFEDSDYTWMPGSPGTEFDSPHIVAGDGIKVGDVDTANDSLQVWIMYKPDGGVWVPLQMYSYSWAVTLTWNAAGQWAISGQSPPPPNAGPTYTGADTNDPPQWTVIQMNDE